MNDFNRKVEEASARVSKTVAEAAERHREGDRRIHQVSERRGCARRSPALHQGLARRLGKAYRTSRLYGAATASHEISVTLARLHRTLGSMHAPFFYLRFCFSAVAAIPSRRRSNVPPPPPSPDPSPEPNSTNRPEDAAAKK